jgi:hypothetical protein
MSWSVAGAGWSGRRAGARGTADQRCADRGAGVASGQASGELMPLIYELADERDLPAQAPGEQHRMASPHPYPGKDRGSW